MQAACLIARFFIIRCKMYSLISVSLCSNKHSTSGVEDVLNLVAVAY
jgi:hypothetical protein